MYICTVKLAGVLVDPSTEQVYDVLNIEALVDYDEKQYGRGLYAVVKIYNQLMEQTGEEVLDWRYTRHTDTFNDLLRLYANTRWTGNNGSYRFEELCDKI